ncbi:MAG: carbohydrate ABC transporter permease, partial [Deltaproteobacteria bacterium]|nr:carbohydrate ABC transporter permease [Deltaproteobacteria bacterium]
MLRFMGKELNREKFEIMAIRILRIAGLVFFIIIVAFPFYWMLVSSFKSLEELLLKPANLWLDLRKLNLNAYSEVLFTHGFARYILNSTYVSIITVVLSVTLATIGGYAVTRLRFRGQGLMSLGILLIYMFPAIVLVIPLYVIFSKFGLRDSVNILVLVYLAQTLPVALY